MDVKTIDTLDEVLMEQKLHSAVEVVNEVLKRRGNEDIIGMDDILWMRNVADQQFKNGMTIKLFRKER
jgi:hypothetical protein